MSLICVCTLTATLGLCAMSEVSTTPITVARLAAEVTGTNALGEDEVVELVDRLATLPLTGPGGDEGVISIDEASGTWTLLRAEGAITRPIRPEILLRYATFDPLEGVPAVDPRLAGQGGSIYIVQFWTGWLERYTAELSGAGARVLKYLPEQCVIVEAADGRALAGLPFVRWAGRYEPAYRVDPALLPALMTGGGLVVRTTAAAEYRVQVFRRGLGQKQSLATFIQGIGGQVTAKPAGGFLLRARLTADQLGAVLHRNEVQFVDRVEGPPGEDEDLARQLGWANGLEAVTGLNGQGVRAEVMDGSLRATHADFQNPAPLLHGVIAGDQTHGTQVYGIVFSKGVSSPAARGLLPGAEQGIFADYGQLVDRYAHTAELVDPTGPYRAVFQTNSWGNDQTTDYTTISMELDDITFLDDIAILQSQSNAGTTESRPESWSKNVVSVGAVLHRETLDLSDDCWCGGASIGPAADGRIKPDLCHFGDGVTTSSRTSDLAFTTNFNGTSAATPITAGYFGLMFQMWHEGFFPGFGRRESVFLSRPHMTTAKALMINTARQYAFHGRTGDLSRFHQGWGMVNIRDLFDASERAMIIDESVVLRPFGSVRYNVRVAPGAAELTATMTFADPAGNTAATRARINDLDLLVLAPDGTEYRGNAGLKDGPYSMPGGEPDRIDTVENVILANPPSGVYTVVVTAAEINEDGHVETGWLDADFALVVSGIAGTGCEADWNQDGVVGLLDLLGYLDSWFGGNADTDGDGKSDVVDLLAYLDAFFEGCTTS